MYLFALYFLLTGLLILVLVIDSSLIHAPRNNVHCDISRQTNNVFSHFLPVCNWEGLPKLNRMKKEISPFGIHKYSFVSSLQNLSSYRDEWHFPCHSLHEEREYQS